MKRNFAKIISILLVVIMIIGCMPLSLAATPSQDAKQPTTAKSEPQQVAKQQPPKNEPQKAAQTKAISFDKTISRTCIKGVVTDQRFGTPASGDTLKSVDWADGVLTPGISAVTISDGSMHFTGTPTTVGVFESYWEVVYDVAGVVVYKLVITVIDKSDVDVHESFKFLKGSSHKYVDFAFSRPDASLRDYTLIGGELPTGCYCTERDFYNNLIFHYEPTTIGTFYYYYRVFHDFDGYVTYELEITVVDDIQEFDIYKTVERDYVVNKKIDPDYDSLTDVESERIQSHGIITGTLPAGLNGPTIFSPRTDFSFYGTPTELGTFVIYLHVQARNSDVKVYKIIVNIIPTDTYETVDMKLIDGRYNLHCYGFYDHPEEAINATLLSGTCPTGLVVTNIDTEYDELYVSGTITGMGHYTVFVEVDYQIIGKVVYRLNIEVVNDVSEFGAYDTITRTYIADGEYVNSIIVEDRGVILESCTILEGDFPEDFSYYIGYDSPCHISLSGTPSIPGSTTVYLKVQYRDDMIKIYKIEINVIPIPDETLSFRTLEGLNECFYFGFYEDNDEQILNTALIAGEYPGSDWNLSYTNSYGEVYIYGTSGTAGTYKLYIEVEYKKAGKVLYEITIEVESSIDDFTADETIKKNYLVGTEFYNDVIIEAEEGDSIEAVIIIDDSNGPDPYEIDMGWDYVTYPMVWLYGNPTTTGYYTVMFRVQFRKAGFKLYKLVIDVVDAPVVVLSDTIFANNYSSFTFGFPNADDSLISVEYFDGEYPTGHSWELSANTGGESNKYHEIYISGFATTPGEYTVVIKAEYDNAGTVLYEITFTVTDDLSDYTITETIEIEHYINEPCSYTIEQVEDDKWLTAYSFFGGDLPNGLTGTGNTVYGGNVGYSGTPTVLGTYTTYCKVQYKGSEPVIYEIVINIVEKPIPTFTVTFVDGVTGDTISTITVEEGSDAEMPTPPTHEGYTFTGWDKDGKNITEDTTITAQYVKVFTVTFVDSVTGDTISTITVEQGCDAEMPTPPIHEGYTFTGWDKEGKNITEDTTITAQYEKEEAVTFTVTFVDGVTGDTISTVTVEQGKDVTLPTAPDHTSEGYKFIAWDNDGKNITAHITITATYQKGYMLGDANGDGVVNTGDAVTILKFVAGMIELLTGFEPIADANGDGVVNTGDAVTLLKAVAGMATIPEEWIWTE